jgi:hypothetical protein
VRSFGLTIVGTVLLVVACAQHPAPRITLEDGACTPSPSFRIDGPEAPAFITVENTSGQPGRADATTLWRAGRASLHRHG